MFLLGKQLMMGSDTSTYRPLNARLGAFEPCCCWFRRCRRRRRAD